MVRWLKTWLKSGALRKARAARDEAFAAYRSAVSRKDRRDQHATHRILVARLNDVLKLERAL